MRWKRVFLCGLLAGLPGVGVARAGEPATAPAEKPIVLKHLTVDRAGREIRLPARLVQASYALEFLLCKAETKEYESVLATRAEPSELHAALLMLGLRPGIPGGYVGKAFVPPRGPKLSIDVLWTDADGKEHLAPAGQWLGQAKQAETARRPEYWIFVGSEVLPDGRYLADETGGIIAVANLGSAVIDVPFESTKTMEQRAYAAKADALPPAGTKVVLRIRPLPGEEHSPYARALLEIDARGALRIDNQPITPGRLTAWAETFTDRHPRGMVTIRSAAEAPAGLAMQAQDRLKLGGVFTFDHRTTSPSVELLPRTAGQLRETLAEWDARFAEPHEQLVDPAEQAARTLRALRRQQAELQRLEKLWSQYRDALQQRIEACPTPAEAEQADDEQAEP